MPKRRYHRKFLAPALKEGEVLPIDPTNPLKNQIPQLDAFIAQGLAAGKTVVELMAQVLPSIADRQAAQAERIRQDNERKTAQRLAHRAALDAPEKRAAEAEAFGKRTAAIAARKAARLARLEAKAEARKKALAENPTLKWRHPRRKGWKPPAGSGYPGAE